jgi:nucleotide-binding universal stress UspA family protein
VTASPFRQVLVGWDGSASAAEALNAAAWIAGGDGGHVVALAVLKAAPRFEAADDDDGSARAAINYLADEQFERARRTGPQGVRMSLRIVENERVGPTVCDYATEHGFDLLVVGRHGDGGVLHPRLGRVAKAAVRDCAIPVLLV